jgi:hypothetical protein
VPASQYAYTVFGVGSGAGYGAYAGPGAVVSVHTTLRAQTVDFQAGYDMGLGSMIGLRDLRSTILGGGRYLNVRQSTEVTFAGGPQQVTAKRVSSFIGWGPTLGLDAGMPVYGHFGVEGGILGGLLFGDISSDSTVTTSTGFAAAGSRRFTEGRTARSFDARFALTYDWPLGATMNLQLAAGYELTRLMYVRDTQAVTGTFVRNLTGSTSADVSYDGPFLRAKFSF